MKVINVGDHVQYSARFLRSIGTYTGPVPFAKGIVTKIVRLGDGGSKLAVIKWDTPDMPAAVNTTNLKIVGTVELD